MSESRPSSSHVPMFAPGSVVAVVASRWNGEVVGKLLAGCEVRLAALGATAAIFRVPGAFELPTAAKWLAESDHFAAVICLGCVIRGETYHFEVVAGEAARGVMRVSLDTGVPTILGVLTVDTQEQALARAGGPHGHAGEAAADAAAEMAALRNQVVAASYTADRG